MAINPDRRRRIVYSALILAAVAVAFYLSFVFMAVTRA